MKKTLFTLSIFILGLHHLTAQIDSTFLAAIQANKLQQVDSLLQTNINLHATDEHGANALMWACYHADSAMVALLFENGAKAPKEGGGIYFDTKNIYETPVNGWYGGLLSIAAGENKEKLLAYLIEEKNLDINRQAVHSTIDSLSGWTPLMHAAFNGRTKAVKVLLVKGADKVLENNSRKKAYEISPDFIINEGIKNNKIEKLDSLISIDVINHQILKEYQKGQYQKALEYALEHEQVVFGLYGENHIFYTGSLNTIAVLSSGLGDTEKALVTLKKIIPIIETLGEQDKPIYGISLNNIATMSKELAFYEDALYYYQAAIDDTKKKHGDSHVDYQIRLANLAGVYSDLGRYDKSMELNKKALSLAELHGRTDTKHYGITLNNLQVNYEKRGDYEEALKIANALMERSKKTLEEGHPYFGIRYNNLAAIHSSMKDYDKAILFYKKALDNTEKNQGKDYFKYGIRQMNLAEVYQKKGLFEEAKKHYTASLENTSKSLGLKHPKHGISLSLTGDFYQVINEKEKVKEIYFELLKHGMFAFNDRFPYLNTYSQLGLKETYTKMRNQMNSFFLNENEFPKELMDYNLHLKGLVVGNIYQILDKKDTEQYDEWLVLRKKIGKELSKSIQKQNKKLQEWETKASNLELVIARENKRFQNQNQLYTESSLQASLQASEAIIDIVHFDYYDIERKTDTVLYVANLISPKNELIQSIPLFQERELQAVLKNTHQHIAAVDKLYTARGLTPDRKITDLENLTFIWQPLLPYLMEYKTLYLSPSGLLNKINLGAIPIAKDSLMMDKFDIVQFNNLRSMLNVYDENQANDFLLIGGINYDYEATIADSNTAHTETLTSTAEYIDTEIKTLRSELGTTWKYLPGTQKEVTDLKQLLATKQLSSTLLEGKKATESELKKILTQPVSPRVVHISTHGFFYPNVENKDEKSAFKISENPMIRSGLILSEANYAWQKGELAPNRAEDGILTAYEVANLNLTDTELVVLSACETGLGDIQDSEGVMGLQRAFKIAGARYVMMSLWKVPDEATQRLMTAFYTNWLDKEMDIRTAFNLAQKSLQADYDSPYYWAGFVLVE